MERVAIFPGSFDPFTIGHEALVHRGLLLFDKVIIAVGYNAAKSGSFSLNARMAMIKKVFADNPNVEVDSYEGLTIDYCRKKRIPFLIRGLRTAADFEFERTVAQVNRAMNNDIETVFLLTDPEYSFINSTVIRDILIHKGDASSFVPSIVNLSDYINK
ncbi:MAG: pantetheine-phosphate adenylyltransferase [Prevotellaceae bacterium]|jgi:pantetheine-phosphate adenylyltransferase|nr:pantetheine-phosphate adenylyltransferase [Prevotellaceae bacterium]